MRLAFCCLIVLIGLMSAAVVRGEESPAGESQGGQEGAAGEQQRNVDPTILLVRDASVRAELGLSDSQRQAIDALVKKHNQILLAIRDVGPSVDHPSVKPVLAEIRDEFARILTEPQRARLAGITLQAQGYSSLLRKDLSAQLQLTDAQRRELSTVFAETRAAAQELRKSGAGDKGEELQEKLAALQKQQQQQVVKILNKGQVAKFAALLGAPFDLTKATPSPADAPEFDASNAWLNSEPLTMESLRGKVVVVHFFAFGCINCIHNYPWYKDWQENLTSKGVVLIGIHTPETANEAKRELLEASLAKHGLKFPVAIDNDKKMWQAWNNSIWPSVYIIDKRGRLRFWWYGELDWQGAGNQTVAKQQIEQLLAEP